MFQTRLLSRILLPLILLSGSLWAQQPDEVTKNVPLEGAARLDISIDFGVGRLNVGAADLKDTARLKVYYDPRYVDFDVDYDKRGETGRLTLESDVHNNRHRDHNGDVDNEWELALPKNYPTSLEISIGASEADLDFGGLSLTDLEVKVGASSGRIDWSEPNPERLHELSLDVGASSLDVTGLGYANAERINCKVGAGSCDLDFHDGIKGDCELDLDVGVGSADITVPKGTALRVEGGGGWFSDFDFSGLDLRKTHRDNWETDDFDSATDRLTIRASVSMGSIDIRGRR